MEQLVHMFIMIKKKNGNGELLEEIIKEEQVIQIMLHLREWVNKE